MKLGLVTYQLAAEWDLDTIIRKGEELGYKGVELRTTHKHGVEPSLSKAEREKVRKKFADSSVKLVGLGSVCDYHTSDPEELRKKIEETKAFILLARDVGAEGVKVRPNAFPEGVPKEKTIEQIGLSLGEVSRFAADYGVKIRLEVHGAGTAHPPFIKQMVDIANHSNCYVCWNSNLTDLDENGCLDRNFALLSDKIEIVHINELSNEYPWVRLFYLLQKKNFTGWCLAEVGGSSEPERFFRYYRALFEAYCRLAQLSL